MSRRVFGALVASSAVLFSWAALSQPGSTGSWALLSKPIVLWNTFITVDTGVTDGDDELRDIARSPTGEVYVVGKQANDRSFSISDEDQIVVARFSADGGLDWKVAFGGTGTDDYDRANAIVLASADEVYVAGETQSNAYSVKLPDGGQGSTSRGAKDGFVARLNPQDGGVSWFFHFGGASDDEVLDMAGVDGGLIIVGRTRSDTLPGSTDPVITDSEGFISLLALQGNNPPRVEWTRLISGSGTADEARGVAVLPGETPTVFIAGTTNSADLLSGVAQRNDFDGGEDGYLAKFDFARREPVALHFLGGRGTDNLFAVVADPSNNQVVVAGGTTSADFMGTSVPDGGVAAGLFVARFDQDVQWLKTVRIPGTLATDRGGLTLGENRSVYVGGSANSQAVPLVNEFDKILAGATEGYVAQVQFESAPSITWASFVGGNSSDDHVLALLAEPRGSLLIGGSSASTDLMLYSGTGHDRTQANGNDMFLLAVAEQSLSDAGVLDGGAPRQDAGEPQTDAGTAGDGGTGGEEDPRLESPLGWSCGASTTGGGPGALALGTLAALVLLASRRERATSGH